MVSEREFIELALSFNGSIQQPHFERTGFKVKGKRMFATYRFKDNTANIILSLEEQKTFCALDPEHIHPVPNKWGERGFTTFHLNHLPQEWVQEALYSAYRETLKPKKS
ncbi:MAG: MmcQ/YjbR family DNA-binding protein [Flavobacteriaceae bacterium]